MRVQLITPTGARPEALALCIRYMQRQTIRDWRWLILDDGEPATTIEALTDRRISIVRPDWRWSPGCNTQKVNMRSLLDRVLWHSSFDLLFVIEDDDWYAPTYLELMINEIASQQIIVGQSYAHFYNVRLRQARILPNTEHTALCRTAVKPEGAQLMREVFNMSEWPEGQHGDRVLWDMIPSERKCLFTLRYPFNVGIKGMPGRGGAGTGHDRITRDRIDDPNLQVLKTWIGDDARHYAQYHHEKQPRRRAR